MNTDSPLIAVSEPERLPTGRFAPGNTVGLTGRPKGALSGRSQALAVLDKIMAESETQAVLETALREDFAADPVRFFKAMIMPLLPTEQRVKVQNELAGAVVWKSLLTTFPLEPTDRPDESVE